MRRVVPAKEARHSSQFESHYDDMLYSVKRSQGSSCGHFYHILYTYSILTNESMSCNQRSSSISRFQEQSDSC